jgi:capsular exopolysaccharide synthesis family protein
MDHRRAAIEKPEHGALTRFPRPATSFREREQNDTAWQALRPVTFDSKKLAERRLVSLDEHDETRHVFDILRTKVLRTLRQNDWTTIAITSPTEDCGKTLVASNLAFSFSRHADCRTVLVDLDLRQPAVAPLLGLQPKHSMASYLDGACSLPDAFVRYRDNLAIGANGTPTRQSSELLQRPSTETSLAALRDAFRPDVVLIDLPPMLVTDDALVVLPFVDCVILVAGAEISTFSEIENCERTLAEESNLLGVVLNKCRFSPQKYGY